MGGGLAVVMVVATLTFGNSLRTLVSRPALYGSNWTYALNSTANSVPPAATMLLDRDSAVAAWTGVNPAVVQIDGQNVPMLFADTLATLGPPILSGHPLAANDQIVLGAATLAASLR